MTDSTGDTAETANQFIKAAMVLSLPFFTVIFMNEYKTVEFENSDEFVEKRSRFIGHVKPVKTQQEAVSFINSVKSKYWDATHNVYAYVLRENNICRSSDDGEPSGTAGVPVLDVLLKENLVDVCVVVTRYFGGTLLGAGGLVRAYSHGSKIAVESGHIITMATCKILSVSVDYSFYDRMNLLLENAGTNIMDSEFTDAVKIKFSLKSDRVNRLSEKLTELSNGKYRLEELGEEYAKISE